MMSCRRCGRRPVVHYRNDLFDGWFCSRCLNDLVNEYVESVELPLLAAAADIGSPEAPHYFSPDGRGNATGANNTRGSDDA